MGVRCLLVKRRLHGFGNARTRLYPAPLLGGLRGEELRRPDIVDPASRTLLGRRTRSVIVRISQVVRIPYVCPLVVAGIHRRAFPGTNCSPVTYVSASCPYVGPSALRRRLCRTVDGEVSS